MSYARTNAQKATDLAAGGTVEERVAAWIPWAAITNFKSTDKLDIWMPGVTIEVKGKFQPIGERWTKLRPDINPDDLFILDELSMRKGMSTPLTAGYPLCFFVLYDKPLDRWFLARIDEIAVADKVRVNRTGPTGHKKGKLILNLKDFRQMTDPASELADLIEQDAVEEPWKRSECLSLSPIPEV